ncbi:homoserine dehydrogenase [Francisellaceae bacterium]|nr:homoserine dehydrogenase [Francisellaceae bacterium]
MQKIAVVGFGTVGQGLLEILRNKRNKLKQENNYEFQIVAIADNRFGSVYNSNGLDIDLLLSQVAKGESLELIADKLSAEKGLNPIDTIVKTNADIICEATYTDIKTGGPALDHHRVAFENGKHLVTTNKGPVAVDYKNLKAIADKNKCFWGIEGTVIAGTPVIKLIQNELAGCEINEVSGLFNGTTNYMLTEMAKGCDYQSALDQAQKLGYAEADPTADVEGYDVLAKVVIMANVIMGAPLKTSEVKCEGITKITVQDIKDAQAQGKTWKLLGNVKKTDQGVVGEVKPVCLDNSDPLAGVSGATNAIAIDTDLLGKVAVSGPGAGKIETGFALLSDLLAINRL